MQAALRAVEKKQLPHMLCVTNMLLHGIEDPSFVHHDNTLALQHRSPVFCAADIPPVDADRLVASSQ
jgi:type I restriction-modification system DNA methylase subunit